ncbi:MAG: FGGY-family carbohydrate kinase [Lachnospiraceae bacterium]|nr:FGGY-family carbohydrate kinase [Lachnospiraceae bacterium]
MKIAGLDIGTTGCKCTVFDNNGKELGKSYRDYPVKRGISGHEVDVNNLMIGVYEVITEMASKFSDILGIGVTSFGETFVMTDENGTPLAPAMIYTDPRGADECRELCDALGEENLARTTGVSPHEMYGIPKMMWMKKNRPEVYSKCRHIYQMEDYVVYSLTGNAQIDYSLATRSLGFNINTLTWDEKIFDVAGIDINLMSKPVPTGTDAGCITKEVAEKTGLSVNTHIVSISQDQVAAAVGSRAFDGEVGVDGAGTVQCLTPVFDKMPDVEDMRPGKYVIVPYVIPGKYVTYAFSYTGGALIQWCTDNLTKKEKELAKEEGISVNTYLERQYEKEREADGLDKEGPSGMLLLPHFAGAATPYMDTGSKGAIIGLSVASTTADIYRACMEGVTYEMYLNYKNVLKAGACPKKLHATGGGAHSKVWMQMKADVLGIPIVALNTVDAGTVGSAMLTGVAIGVFKDIEDAANHMVEESTVYEPRMDYHEKYMEMYERYEKIYGAIRGLV